MSQEGYWSVNIILIVISIYCINVLLNWQNQTQLSLSITQNHRYID